MIDISGAKFDFSKEEEYAIKWFNENGFSGSLDKQYVSKSIFTIEKDGVTDRFELQQGIVFKDIKKYMELYRESFEMKKRIQSKGVK